MKMSLPLGCTITLLKLRVGPLQHQPPFITLALNDFITLTYLVLMKEQTQLTLASEIKGPLETHS